MDPIIDRLARTAYRRKLYRILSAFGKDGPKGSRHVSAFFLIHFAGWSVVQVAKFYGVTPVTIKHYHDRQLVRVQAVAVCEGLHRIKPFWQYPTRSKTNDSTESTERF